MLTILSVICIAYQILLLWLNRNFQEKHFNGKNKKTHREIKCLTKKEKVSLKTKKSQREIRSLIISKKFHGEIICFYKLF